MTRRILPLVVLPLCACATYVQDRTSLDYAPVNVPSEAFASETTGGIYYPGARGLFVNDRRAASVGDVLTVQFSEQFQASKSQSASAGKSSSFETTLPGFLVGDFDSGELTSGTSQSFSGKGGAAQSNSFTGRLSVSVVRVLPNGNL